MKNIILSILTITLLGCGQETSKPETVVNNDSIPKPSIDNKVFIDNSIIMDITKYYKTKHGKDARAEKDNKDSLLTLSFYSTLKDNEENPLLITIYISKIKDDYITGDLNNDNVEDLVASVSTEGGGGGGNVYWNDIFVFISSNGRLELKSTTQSPSICGATDGYFYPEKINDNMLIGNSYCYAENDPTCCPSQVFYSKIKFNGKILEISSRKKYVTEKHNASITTEFTDTTFKINNENYKITIKTYSNPKQTIADTSEGTITIYPETVNDVTIKSNSSTKTITINKSLFKKIYDPQTLYHSNFGQADIKEIDTKNKKIVLTTFFGFNESDFGEMLHYTLTFDGVFEFIKAEQPEYE